jgi:hypothetical protein
MPKKTKISSLGQKRTFLSSLFRSKAGSDAKKNDLDPKFLAECQEKIQIFMEENSEMAWPDWKKQNYDPKKGKSPIDRLTGYQHFDNNMRNTLFEDVEDLSGMEEMTMIDKVWNSIPK